MLITQRLKLSPALHRDKEVVQLHFDRNEEFTQFLKKHVRLHWSQTMACWYVPYTKSLVSELYRLSQNQFYLDYSEMKREHVVREFVPAPKVVQVSQSRPDKNLGELSAEALLKMEKFKWWLQSKRYSDNTVLTYTDALKTFLRYYAHKAISEIDNDDLIAFNNNYILSNSFSSSFQNQVVNAVKLFFTKIEDKQLQPELLHRPKRAKVLPNVLSKEEVKLILEALVNIKHRAMLSLIYSCGLRRSELLHLRIKDIDSKRQLIVVRRAKGKKDRIVPLSGKILLMLRDYFRTYQPKEWLFEGQGGVGAYDERSLANVLKQALEKSRIDKPVTLHWLRHSYATHLLENGTDLRYIQEILGHSRSTTTEIYTHVSTKGIQNVLSPFDTL